MSPHLQLRRLVAGVLAVVVAATTGCAASRAPVPAPADVPRELNKVTMPEYMIEPPDVLQVDLVRAVPKPPYRIHALDGLIIRGADVLPDEPIAGLYQVDPDGSVNLGLSYGTVQVDGLTLEEAKAAILAQVKKVTKGPAIEVALAQGRAIQQVRGAHLVRPDGMIGLGTYGSVRVVGLTLTQAKKAIEDHLSQYFQNPEISLDVAGFNSKVYYVVFDGGGAGASVIRLPVTGNETVLDAVGQISGLSAIADTRRIWVSRPTPGADCGMTVLPVDWHGIVEVGDSRTNYQLMPGDRLFVRAQPSITAMTKIDRFLNPIERVLGFSLLGAGTYNTFSNLGNNSGNNGGF